MTCIPSISSTSTYINYSFHRHSGFEDLDLSIIIIIFGYYYTAPSSSAILLIILIIYSVMTSQYICSLYLMILFNQETLKLLRKSDQEINQTIPYVFNCGILDNQIVYKYIVFGRPRFVIVASTIITFKSRLRVTTSLPDD